MPSPSLIFLSLDVVRVHTFPPTDCIRVPIKQSAIVNRGVVYQQAWYQISLGERNKRKDERHTSLPRK